MAIKVSVVVPVYNPGAYLDRCVNSLLAQTLPPEELELIFVDDGSTDDTPERLDRLAREHAQVKVIHIPNSGWPGKPRNIGVDAAQGEYVQFVDQDDAMAPDALRRLYDMGRRNDSDIVIGKVASNWRTIPALVFRKTRERCTIHDFQLYDSLTPHKMFRRAFLHEHGIRYPEGKRRLEDQLYMMQAYFAASNVSILADYTCYWYLRRDDGKNAGSARIDPPGYYQNLRDVLDVVYRHTRPGPFRDKILRRFYQVEMLRRIVEAVQRDYPQDYKESLFTEIYKLAHERIPESADEGLPALWRIQSHLLRTERRDDLLEFVRRCLAVKGRTRVEEVRWSDGCVSARFSANLVDGDRNPLGLYQKGDAFYVDPVLTDGLLPPDHPAAETVPKTLRAEVSIKNRDSAVSWDVPAKLEARFGEPTGPFDARPATLHGDLVLDQERLAGGRPLERGIWDVYVRVLMHGFDRKPRLGDRTKSVPEIGLPGLLGRPAMLVVPYFTDPHGNLSLDVERYGNKTLARVLPRYADAIAPMPGDGRRVELTLPIVSHSATAPVAVELLARRLTESTNGDGAVHADEAKAEQGAGAEETGTVLPARLEPVGSRTRLVLDLRDPAVPTPSAGTWRLLGRLDAASTATVALGDLEVDQRGRAYLRGASRLTAVDRASRQVQRTFSRLRLLKRAARRTAGRVRRRLRDRVATLARRVRQSSR